jgi:hypothetical protein
MSIVSGTGTVHLTEDVHSAMLAISCQYDTSSSNSELMPLFVPFCTLKLVNSSQSTFTVDVTSSTSTDTGAVPLTWESLVASLPGDQCCMAMAQVPWCTHTDGVVCMWLVFLLWAPNSTSTKEHMLASMFSKGTKGMINQWGTSMSLPIQATGVDDLALKDIEDKIHTKATIK